MCPGRDRTETVRGAPDVSQRPSGGGYGARWKRGRAAECTRLESESPERVRGFESLRFRQVTAVSAIIVALGGPVDINR